VAGTFANLRSAITQRSGREQAERDTVGDTLPLATAAVVAWWTTVRPAAFFPGSTWQETTPSRAAALVAAAGIVISAFAIVRGARHFVAIAIGSFLVPCAVTWILGPESATALSEPLEVLLGGIGWTTFGIVLMRPQAVAVPRGAEGGRGPSIGAGDDLARVTMKDLEFELAAQEPVVKLQPRQKQPRLAALPVVVAGLIAALVGWQVMRVAPSAPDRAVLARIVGAACAIALLSTAGDVVEARYLTRKVPKPRSRLQRSMISLAAVVILAFIHFVAFGGRD
jgi:hypothetical protein